MINLCVGKVWSNYQRLLSDVRERLWREWKSLMLLFQWPSVCCAEVTCSSFLSIFLKSQCLSFSMLPFISHKAFHLSIHNRHSSYLPEHHFSTWCSSTRANELNSSIYLWKQLIVFCRRTSTILSFRYSFYVLYILFMSHTHTQLKSDSFLSSDEQWIYWVAAVSDLNFNLIYMT